MVINPDVDYDLEFVFWYLFQATYSLGTEDFTDNFATFIEKGVKKKQASLLEVDSTAFSRMSANIFIGDDDYSEAELEELLDLSGEHEIWQPLEDLPHMVIAYLAYGMEASGQVWEHQFYSTLANTLAEAVAGRQTEVLNPYRIASHYEAIKERIDPVFRFVFNMSSGDLTFPFQKKDYGFDEIRGLFDGIYDS